MAHVPGNKALAVSYGQIVLQSHYTYRKKSFIEKLSISNQVKKEDIDSSNFIGGMLIVDEKEKRLIFRPHEYMNNELSYYQEDFFRKMSVKFNNIKNIIFINKNNEYITFKSSESISKSYRSFIICCYDFRIYNYSRLSVHNKQEAIKFYQYLYRIIFENNVQHYNFKIWENVSCDIIQKIYYSTISKKIKIKLKTVKSTLVIAPLKIYEIRKFDNFFEFGPQIIYHSNHNESYLLVIDKSADKDFVSHLKRMSKELLPSNDLEPITFYLNNDNFNKTDLIFPTTKDLNESFEKLFNLCTPRNKADFKRTDKKWMTKLWDCGWLSLVNRCLQITKLILKSLSPFSISVYMIENGFPIWGWMYGSLVQIICQPLVRTFDGFLSMIEKNWILSGAYNNQNSPKPQLFLLFLDCVYQLLRFSPFQFEFNEEMLICLYDLFTLSPPGFMSSTDYEFRKFDWNHFFVEQVLECLENRAFCEKEMNCCLNIQKVESTDFGSFWFKMYARWIPYMQVEGGSLSDRHFFMITSMDLDGPVYSNYPFSLNYDKITVADYNNNDDTRSINTVASDS